MRKSCSPVSTLSSASSVKHLKRTQYKLKRHHFFRKTAHEGDNSGRLPAILPSVIGSRPEVTKRKARSVRSKSQKTTGLVNLGLNSDIPDKRGSDSSVATTSTDSSSQKQLHRSNTVKIQFDRCDEIIQSCQSLRKHISQLKPEEPPELFKQALDQLLVEKAKLDYEQYLSKQFLNKIENPMFFEKKTLRNAFVEKDENTCFVNKLGKRKVWKFQSRALPVRRDDEIRTHANQGV